MIIFILAILSIILLFGIIGILIYFGLDEDMEEQEPEYLDEDHTLWGR